MAKFIFTYQIEENPIT